MAFKSVLQKCYIFILDLLFPIYCLGCGEEGKWICAGCSEKINLLKIQACPICGADSKTGSRCFNCRNKSELDGVIAAAAYWEPKTVIEKEKEKTRDLVKEAVHIFKYRFVKDLASPLSGLMIRQLKNRQLVKKEIPIPFGPDIVEDRVVIPVPLHPKRFRWRGFNQSEFLAVRIAAHFNFPLEKSALLRIKNNIPQADIKERRERLENIRGAFDCVDREAVKGKRVILVDDVCTTSGTMSECARALKNAGAKEVWGVVVARG